MQDSKKKNRIDNANIYSTDSENNWYIHIYLARYSPFYEFDKITVCWHVRIIDKSSPWYHGIRMHIHRIVCATRIELVPWINDTNHK